MSTENRNMGNLISMPINEILFLDETCPITGLSLSRTYKVYHLWPNYGVRILKDRPEARPRFYRKDLLRMMEKQK